VRRHLLRVLVAAALTLGVSPAPALADGDPASDYLLSQNVFLPFDAKVPGPVAQELSGLTVDAKSKGYPIRVALIAKRYDLGAVTALWLKPQPYAHFLAQELSFVYRGRLLIVMPNGFGIYHLGHPTTRERRALAGLAVSPGGEGMARSAIAAVKRLAAASGVKVVPREAPPSRSGGTHDRFVILLVVAGVLLLLTIFVPRRRRRPR
jgi:hypothetical protein